MSGEAGAVLPGCVLSGSVATLTAPILCGVCRGPIPQRARRHGSARKHCSETCRRIAWERANPGRRGIPVEARQRPLPFAPEPDPLIQPRDRRVKARRRGFSEQSKRILDRLEAGPVANVELALMFPPATAWRSRLSDVRWELRRRFGLVKDKDPDPIPGHDCGGGIVWHWIERT